MFLAFLLLLSIGNQVNAFEEDKTLWPLIETQLDRPESDTSHNFIFLLVRGHCGDNYNCLYPTYSVLREKLERRFDLPAAIEVCLEMVRISNVQGDLEGEANAFMQLFRFYDALGEDEQALISMEKARKLYEQSGNQQAIAQIRINKLENSLRHRSLEEVLPEMEALLEEVTLKKDTFSMNLFEPPPDPLCPKRRRIRTDGQACSSS